MSIENLLKSAADLGIPSGAFGALTTYRTGGQARGFVTFNTREELVAMGAELATCERITVLGNGSNMLVADSEYNGLVVHLGESFTSLVIDATAQGRALITIGAALDLPIAARRIADSGLTGFEWAVGVPGTIGGAVTMNAGGHGSDMAAAVTSVELWRIDEQRIDVIAAENLQFAYRSSAIGPRDIVLSVTLRLKEGEAQASKDQLKEIVRWRREHQPGGSNAGSVFRNPPNESAGSIIERCGLKGHRIGTAQVSEKHANFIQADEHGSSNDVRALIRYVHDEVLRREGIDLVTEIRFVGFDE
ncbi:MAG: UDP-N-acetylmuramate dehydrogenase [Actinobacteria bacterium]|uniref:UDP-N-acetylmuramate dehydrogenase n=1 Tax=freshwater metagenome TaxID=449393 RepID=A0A6J6WKF9_9ZZZZ|nr:UDP-N-acetylmuramate dehydrogenase [Actinomycetota bacterium]